LLFLLSIGHSLSASLFLDQESIIGSSVVVPLEVGAISENIASFSSKPFGRLEQVDELPSFDEESSEILLVMKMIQIKGLIKPAPPSFWFSPRAIVLEEQNEMLENQDSDNGSVAGRTDFPSLY